MSTLSSKDIGDLMTMYSLRPCLLSEALPRENIKDNPIYLFDRGHLRTLSRPVRGTYIIDASGEHIYIRGKKTAVNDWSGNPGDNLYVPKDFYPVPIRVALLYFATKASVNCDKIENAIMKYRRDYWTWFDDQSLPRVVRPTLNMLQLDRGSEFENFLKPLISFYVSRLKSSFDYLLDLCEERTVTGEPTYTVFTEMNRLYFPDDRQTKDLQVEEHWDQSRGYIWVRASNFASWDDVEPELPDRTPPFPPNAPTPPGPVAINRRNSIQGPIDLDKKILDQHFDDFVRMRPWEQAVRVVNPFKSPEYRFAWASVQHEFELKYNTFLNEMLAKRKQHQKDWKNYKLYRKQLKDYSYTKVLPTLYAERPQNEDFTLEFREFIFGLRQQMKNFKFDPVNVDDVRRSISSDRRNPSVPSNGNYIAVKPDVLMI